MYIRNPPRAITSHGRHGKEQIFKHIENLFYMKFRGGYLDFHAYGIEKSQIATAGIRQQSTRATVELANAFTKRFTSCSDLADAIAMRPHVTIKRADMECFQDMQEDDT